MYAFRRITVWRGGNTLLGLGIGLLLSACAVGPDYRRPAAPAAHDYAPTALPKTTAAVPGPGGNAQQFVQDMDIPGPVSYTHLTLPTILRV